MGIARKIYYYDKRAQRRNPPIRLSSGEHVGLWIFVIVAFWPFCLCIKGSTELMIALLWWGFLALLILNQKQKEKRGKKPKRPFVAMGIGPGDDSDLNTDPNLWGANPEPRLQ